jgi:hypothetical protein
MPKSILKRKLSAVSIAWTIAAFLSFLPAAAQTPKPPENDVAHVSDTASSFLQSYSKLRKRGLSGIPDQKQLTQLERFFTPSLRTLFVAAIKEQRRCIKRFPSDKPPWIEGDIFSSSFEGFDSFAIEKSVIDDDAATLIIKYTTQQKPDSANTSWQDALLLKKIGTTWHVDDMQYRGDFAFGSGFGVSLRQSLQGIPAC